MGSTAILRTTNTCPNCNERGEQTAVEGNHNDALYDCHNERCTVDRFWAEKDQ